MRAEGQLVIRCFAEQTNNCAVLYLSVSLVFSKTDMNNFISSCGFVLVKVMVKWSNKSSDSKLMTRMRASLME